MTNSSPLISILIPFRNAEKYLHDCLESIRTQTETHWQVIAVNDHSTDGSVQIIREYAVKDSRFKIIDNRGEGIIAALRIALANSTGNLITRMDADDIMTPVKLTTLKKILIENGRGFVATGLVKYFKNPELGPGYQRYEKWLNEIHTQGKGYEQIYKECVLPSPCWMLWRDDLEKAGAFNSDIYPEDYDLCFRLYKNNIAIVPALEVLHHWRDYPERTSRTDPRLEDQGFMDLKLTRFLELEVTPDQKLVLWGAAERGKILAKLLLAKDRRFDWVCNNPRREGQTIYQKRILSYKTISDPEDSVVIVATVQDGAREEITRYLNEKKFIEYQNYYFFC